MNFKMICSGGDRGREDKTGRPWRNSNADRSWSQISC